MNFPLPSQALSVIRRNVSGSLSDTFQMMFQLDVFLMPSLSRNAEDQLVSAYVEMAYGETRAFIVITATRLLLEHISAQMGTQTSPRMQEITQDIAGEITNIVSNHLRSYLSDKMGVEFDISLPRAGQPVADIAPQMFNLHFRIREQDSIDLDFRYAVKALPASHRTEESGMKPRLTSLSVSEDTGIA